jgi:hypothetical protein
MRAIAADERAGVLELMYRFEIAGRKSPVVALLCLILYFCQPANAWAQNRAPVISGTPPTTATVGRVYSFTPTASDPDGQVLTFRINWKPTWASFSKTTGRLSGTPPRARTWTGLIITVSDGRISRSLPAFSITATAATNRPPVIGGTPATSVIVGQTYTFTPTASDPEGQALTFRITNKPAWATFSTSTGRLRGTPTSTQVGTYSNIVIAVSDGTTTVSRPAFSIAVRSSGTVESPNRAPVISGVPVTSATVGQPYSFRPTVSDADGNRLNFSITNRPAWASFDSTNGTLYGTPGGTGTFSGIGITVSGGTASASLAPFSVTVSPARATSVTLSWVPPTTNTDGTRLVGLAGFRVFYGTAPGQYSQNLSITGPSVTSVVLEGLSSGLTWYFAVTAVASDGVESAYATEVSKRLL